MPPNPSGIYQQTKNTNKGADEAHSYLNHPNFQAQCRIKLGNPIWNLHYPHELRKQVIQEVFNSKVIRQTTLWGFDMDWEVLVHTAVLSYGDY